MNYRHSQICTFRMFLFNMCLTTEIELQKKHTNSYHYVQSSKKKRGTLPNSTAILRTKKFTNRLMITCANYNYTEIFFMTCLHIKMDQILKLF